MISIQILNPTTAEQLAYQDNAGRVLLDLDSDFNVRLTKVLEQLTAQNKVAQEAALSNSILATHKNRRLLEEYNINILNRKVPSIKIEAQKDGVILDVDRLRVLGLNDQTNRYEIEMFGGGWIDDLEECNISELDLGTYEYTLANVLASWADTTALAVPTAANYGFFYTPGDLTRKDLRFRFNLWKLLKLAFCKIGWQVKSPFYEGAVGSRLYGYLSPEDWSAYDTKDSTWTTETNIAAPRALTGAPEYIEFDELVDIENQYGVFGGRGQFRYLNSTDTPTRLRIVVEHIVVILPPNIIPGTFKLEVIKERGSSGFPGGVTETILRTFEFTASNYEEIEQNISFEVIDENCDFNQLDIYYIRMRYQWTNISNITFDLAYTLNSGIIKYIPDFNRYVEDNTIPLAQLLDPEISCERLLSGMVHLISGLITTNLAARTVTIFSPFDATVGGELLPGYFRRNVGANDVSNSIVPNSQILEFTDTQRDRYILLRFKNSTDAWIAQTATEEHPHSRLVDLGSGKNETKELDNPLFEPTLPIFTEPTSVGGTGIYLEAFWDNTDGTLSNKIGPRIGYHFGLVEMEKDDGLGAAFDFDFEGANRTTIGYIAQSLPANVSGLAPSFEVVFKENSQDLYRAFYERYLREQESNINVQFLIFLSINEYLEFDFRSPTAIFYGESVVLYQATAIRDFDITRNISTPIDLKPIDC